MILEAIVGIVGFVGICSFIHETDEAKAKRIEAECQKAIAERQELDELSKMRRKYGRLSPIDYARYNELITMGACYTILPEECEEGDCKTEGCPNDTDHRIGYCGPCRYEYATKRSV